MAKKAKATAGAKKKRPRKKRAQPSTSPPADESKTDRVWREVSRRRRQADRLPYAEALTWGTVVAVVAAVLTGFLRIWIWILALEAIAIGVVIGEAAAAPSSVRRRHPPRWTYLYVFGLGCFTYLLVHLTFWLASSGFRPDQSFFAFLRAAPSATATPFFQSVDLARQISLATGGATALKYGLWLAEGLLMGLAAVAAYRGGSVRKLKT
ncbi:MAG: hypothetical protein GWN99_12735 [Gemmatimonadetes bacterium]|uniref:Uncharacterized protein n=1 Tax=Candidatus Kutchimonas denitrificans TaxID=3056748 RepID=A0AAE4Z9M4_9BACT|nr:hypothetical protein [Gemmatimonadota bacterium]NIR75598.1 hypothetical protein [Candidatus Kutchimonas denitrificans]NIS01912.1 hypothetical protein [Gemmatimonadota bacterium]NIT67693.1 hypothetical protein [Gemmatimonadota bacterium]NIU53567.1 hypothetical protein [Gemmatimonadota bacterium]